VDDASADPVPVLWRWNRQSGAVEFIGTSATLARLQAMEFDRTGTLYGWESSVSAASGKGLVRLSLTTGLATDVYAGSVAPGLGSSTFNIQSLAFDSDGTRYLASQQAIYRIHNNSDHTVLVATYQPAVLSEFRGIAVVPTAFGTWQDSAFPASAGYAQVAAATDYDGDGLQNFVEYALGTDPAVPNSPPAPELIPAGDTSCLGMRWNRPAGRSDVLVSGEICESLDCPAWRSGPSETLTEILPEPDGTETVIIRAVTPPGAGIPRRFLRARFVR